MAGEDVAARLRGEGLDPSPWSNGPADRYGAHDHRYDKVIVVDRGSITFGIPADGRSIALGTGDRLELPAGTRHDAVVGPAGVTCLEAHLPAGSWRPSRGDPPGSGDGAVDAIRRGVVTAVDATRRLAPRLRTGSSVHDQVATRAWTSVMGPQLTRQATQARDH